MQNEKKPFDQAKYTRDYNAVHYDRVELKLPKGLKEEWKSRAKSEGLSLTEFIIRKVGEA